MEFFHLSDKIMMNKYNEWLLNNKIIQSKSYYKRIEAETELKMKLLNIENENNV